MKNTILMYKEDGKVFYREVSKKGIVEITSEDADKYDKFWKKPVILKDHKKIDKLLDKEIKEIAVYTKKVTDTKKTTKKKSNKTTTKIKTKKTNKTTGKKRGRPRKNQ